MKIIVCILVAILSVSFSSGLKKDVKKETREEGSKVRVFGHDGKEHRLFSEELEAAVECIRNLFIEGDELGGFPSLQEIAPFADGPINITNEMFTLYADIANFVIYNLGNFTINKVDFNIIGLIIDYDLEFNITTSGQYANGDLNILNIIDVQGDGNINLAMVINPLGHGSIFPIPISPGSPEWVIGLIEYYGFFLVRPDFHITGIMHDEDFSSAISKQISSLIEQYMDEYAESVSQQLSPIIKDILNELIKDPESILQDIIRLAVDHCPAAKSFVQMLQKEAVKQGFVKI